MTANRPSLRARYEYGLLPRWRRLTDDLCHWVVRRLMPRRLRYWALVVSGAEASIGRYAAKPYPDITFFEVCGTVEVGGKPQVVA